MCPCPCLPRQVIMMSATLDADKFAGYYSDVATASSSGGGGGGGRAGRCPVIDIPGQTFPVEDLFLEDVAALTGYVPRTLAIERAKHQGKSGGGGGGGDGCDGGGGESDPENDGDDDEGDDDDDHGGAGGTGGTGGGGGSEAPAVSRFGERAKAAKAGRELGGAVDVASALDYRLIARLVATVVRARTSSLVLVSLLIVSCFIAMTVLVSLLIVSLP